MKLLAYAMDYWSKGTLKALFLEHEVRIEAESNDLDHDRSYGQRSDTRPISFFNRRVTLARLDVYCSSTVNPVKREET